MTDQSVDLVGCSASNFAGAARTYGYMAPVHKGAWCKFDALPNLPLPHSQPCHPHLGRHNTLLEACQASRNPYRHTIVALALDTGTRRGEIAGVTLADVDLQRATLTFHETKNGER